MFNRLLDGVGLARALLLLAWVGSARAQELPQGWSVLVDGSLSCPKASAIENALSRQLSHAGAWTRETGPTTVKVEAASDSQVRVRVDRSGQVLVRTLKSASDECNALPDAIALIVVTWLREPLLENPKDLVAPSQEKLSLAGQHSPEHAASPEPQATRPEAAQSTEEQATRRITAKEPTSHQAPEPEAPLNESTTRADADREADVARPPRLAERAAQNPPAVPHSVPATSAAQAEERLEDRGRLLRFSFVGLGGADWLVATGSLSPFLSVRPEIVFKGRFGLGLQLSWEKSLSAEASGGSVETSILWAAVFGKLALHSARTSGLELLAGGRLDRLEAKSLGYAVTSSATVTVPSALFAVEWRQFLGRSVFLQAGAMGCLRTHGEGFTINGLGRVLLIPPFSLAASLGSGVEL